MNESSQADCASPPLPNSQAVLPDRMRVTVMIPEGISGVIEAC
jgi:hypothetical protein